MALAQGPIKTKNAAPVPHVDAGAFFVDSCGVMIQATKAKKTTLQ
jgi:hypothetical protein